MTYRPKHAGARESAQQVFEIKSAAIDSEKRTFEGLASVWGLDLGDDVMHKGAFKDTINNWRISGDSIPLLNSHKQYDVLAAFGQLIDAKETNEGLWTKWEIIPGAEGDQILARLRPGSNGRAPVRKMSIGYEAVEYSYEKCDDSRWGEVRHLTKVNLLEVSLVLFPMAPGATIDSATVKRRHSGNRHGSLQAELQRCINAAADHFNDSTAHQVGAALSKARHLLGGSAVRSHLSQSDLMKQVSRALTAHRSRSLR